MGQQGLPIGFAAFYIEPIQGTGGYVIPPKGYFEELSRILHERGILIVVDEIQMGIHRTGKFWSFEHFGLKPDIVVFGKALTNGLNPLSGVWAREELISPQTFSRPARRTRRSPRTRSAPRTALEVMRMVSESDYEGRRQRERRLLSLRLQDLKSAGA